MYFTSPEVGPLDELDDLLAKYGIEFEHGFQVIDENNSLNSSLYNLSADYFVSGNNAGDELTASIRKLPTRPRTIVPYAKPMIVRDNASEGAVAPVLTSFPTSYRIGITEESEEIISEQGSSILFAVMQKSRTVDNNVKTSLLLVSGSYNFLAYLSNKSYANSDIILNAMRITTSRRIATNIDFKLFDSNELIMDLDEQNAWTLITILLLPSVVSVIGIVVWIRRRHS
jgi:ABC-type uncharacterized transport system involved in gliding motility auxiliary subunit